MKNKILLAFLVGAAAGVAAGCQTYDFEPVVPLAIAQTTQSKTVSGRQLKPNLMFLIDKSGSMNFPANDAISPCTAGCTTPCTTTPCPPGSCPMGCRTRLQELRAAMASFLDPTGPNTKIAWMGMAVYPTAVAVNGVVDACGATTLADIRVPLEPKTTDLDADLSAAAAAVNTQIQNLAVANGTPTGDSLKFLGEYPPLSDPNPKLPREDFIVLLTDGLPNCNANNPNSCSNEMACRCTLGTAPGACGMSPSAVFCTKGCLDKDNSAAQVTALRQKRIKTIVIGFGAETASGDGPDTLNTMAENGGFARACPMGTNAECGTTDTCNMTTKFCNRKFFQASSATELAEALKKIAQAIDPAGLCNYQLEATPSDPKFLAVIIDGKNVTGNTADTWSYDGSTGVGKVTFNGALCAKITAAGPEAPVKIEFRIVETL